jgi:iron(III) transport system substrate-binding protein
MTRFTAVSRMLKIAALVVVVSLLWTRSAVTAELSPAEQLYAELAKLPAAERQKRLEEGARKEGKLAVLLGFRGSLARDHISIFRKRYPFLNVDMSDSGSDEAIERVVAEETVGRHLTDVVSTVSVIEVGTLLERNLVARYPTPATEIVWPVYKDFLDPEHRWVPTHWSEQGISYNSKMLTADEAPKSWDDLCKPQYRGQISMDPARVRFLTFLYQLMGEDGAKRWIECMGKNAPIIHDGQSARVTLMLAGDHAIQGGNFFYYGMSLRAKDPERAPFQPIYEAPILAAAGGALINRNTPHPHAAALYADWVVTQEDQKFLVASFRGPVAAKHPFLPEDVKLVTLRVLDTKTTDRLVEFWNKHIGAKRN